MFYHIQMEQKKENLTVALLSAFLDLYIKNYLCLLFASDI